MATTTNFGWTTPDDTDLVKDGAAAIRTLGSAIDTSLVDLKGGTTGQVLSKTSDTDMDFTWVAADDTNAIQNAIMDAKGDLIVATAADTPARLPIGSNGYVLTADSAETSGVKWAAAAAGGKVLQVVNDFTATQESTTSATYVDTALSVSITPSSATSKVLLIVSLCAAAEASSATNSGAIFRLVVGASTQLAEFGLRHQDASANRAIVATTGLQYLDSPNTTSATTYKVQMAQWYSGTTAFLAYGGYYSNIMALEIGA